MSGFRDHFGSVAETYAAARPTYPAALFDWIAAATPSHQMALDCGCGSGQASVALAAHFDQVIATDASAKQIAEATPHPKITYRVAPAERSGLPDASVDLVLVAQALHWFDFAAFFAETTRILKPGGLFVAVSYGIQTVEGDAVNALVQRFYHDRVGAYWPPERAHVENAYRDIEMPFQRIDAPSLAIICDWRLDDLAAYFRSWSATAAYRKAHGHDPVDEVEADLSAVWGGETRLRRVTWPLTILGGYRP